MPRKKKADELAEWLKKYRPFVFEIEGPGISGLVTILAEDVFSATQFAKMKYPALTVTPLNKPNVIHVI